MVQPAYDVSSALIRCSLRSSLTAKHGQAVPSAWSTISQADLLMTIDADQPLKQAAGKTLRLVQDPALSSLEPSLLDVP